MSIINNGLLLASGADAAVGYQISRSLRFNSADSASCSRVFTSTGNRRTWTWAAWIKRSAVSFSAEQHIWGVTGTTDATYGEMFFGTGDTLRFAVGYNTVYGITTTRVFRDPGAWFHVVLAFDATQSTAANKIRLYINGLEETTFSSDTRSSLANQDWGYNNNVAHYIGRNPNSDIRQFNGYLADVHFIDGQALTPSSFAETDATTGQWIPKLYSGSYGTNGFRLTFSDNSGTTSTTLGKDAAGSNNWTPNNFSVASGSGNDSLTDSPTSYGTDTGAGGEVRGNYCTFNPLFALASLTLTNGNLETSSPGAAWRNAKGTFAMTTGKWYWEHTVPTTGAADGYIGGVATATADYSSSSTGIWGRQGTTKYSNGSSSTPFGSTTSGDILGFAFDADAGKLWVAQNGTWVGDPGAGTGESWSGIPSGVFPYVAAYNQANVVNFGQRAFAYTNNRSGFKALCDTNLTAPVIAKPNTVFDVLLWSGSGAGTDKTISGLNFADGPDLVWAKTRSFGYHNNLFDSVRGYGQRNALVSDQTFNEGYAYSGRIKSTNSTSITWENDGGSLWYDSSSQTYVAWCWDAGSSTVTNTQGSITSSVRANANAGFSIVGYTGNGSSGATVGHGGLVNLDKGMIIIKKRTSSPGNTNWRVYHSALGNTQAIYLSDTGAASSNSGFWNNTSPTSTVFTLGSDDGLNASSQTHIAYCFAPVAGYSSFGSYTGNGSADGPFVYTGHRSRWLMVKRTDTSGYPWVIVDALRDGYNVTYKWLEPNSSSAEQSTQPVADVDFLSNGFKMRGVGNTTNQSAGTYIYAAFAESPFQYARAR